MGMRWGILVLFVVNLASLVEAIETDYPIGNLSDSWINNDGNAKGSTTFVDGSTIRPILLNNSNRASSFPAVGCGFYGNRTTNSFYFVVFAVQATSDSTIVSAVPPQILWTANGANPVKENATLEFTDDGDLKLTDANGTSVWSSNTSNLTINQMNVSGNGTLQLVRLYDYSSTDIFWESWDHPVDTWISGQVFGYDQTLRSNISASNLTAGPFYLILQGYSLYAFIESNPPQMYHEVVLGETDTIQFKTGRLEVYGSKNRNDVSVRYVSETENFQYLRLDLDGHLRVYQWIDGVVSQTEDILTDNLGNCAYPTVCGEYGICSGGSCSCPVADDAPSYFTRSGLGCQETTQLSCQSSRLHTFIELDSVTYFGFVTDRSNVDIESCKSACLNNCSCKAALFHYNFNSSNGNCSLPSQVFSLMRSSQELFPYNSTSFIKVQRSLVPPSPPSAHGPTVKSEKKGLRTRFIIALVFTVLSMLIFLILICVRCLRKRRSTEDNPDEEWEKALIHATNLPRRFTYQDLKSATNDFQCKLGGGGFGSVFEGTLVDGTKIAVKRLDRFGQGKKEFLAEVKTIGSIHHINLVRLMGFCAENSQRLLVYEHMSNGSLDKWIFNRNPETALEWKIRKNIILDIAKGIAYLHEECERRIAHLDIKPQNILLDGKFNAKLSDFGLAKLIDRNESQVITQMRGTRGYMAPEWLSRRITEKVDVYSYGVVLLEIVCGRRNLDFSQPDEGEYLLLPIVKQKAQQNQLIDLVDTSSSEDMQQHVEDAVKMMTVAIWCLHNDPTRRPSMSTMVKVLEGVIDMEPFSDYSFLTSTVVEAPAEVVVVPSDPQPPSILSGPR